MHNNYIQCVIQVNTYGCPITKYAGHAHAHIHFGDFYINTYAIIMTTRLLLSDGAVSSVTALLENVDKFFFKCSLHH